MFYPSSLHPSLAMTLRASQHFGTLKKTTTQRCQNWQRQMVWCLSSCVVLLPYPPSSLIFCSSSEVSAAILAPPSSRAWNCVGSNTGLQLRTNNSAINLPNVFYQFRKNILLEKYLACHLVVGSNIVTRKLSRWKLIHIRVLRRSLISVFTCSIFQLYCFWIMTAYLIIYTFCKHTGYNLQICRRFPASRHQHRREEGGEPAQSVPPSQPLPAAELRKWRGKVFQWSHFNHPYLKFVE